MSSRIESRKDILEDAHEGHEEYHPKIRVERVGPRKWLSMSEGGYDYFETIQNWEMSKAQLVGFLIVIAGAIAVLGLYFVLK